MYILKKYVSNVYYVTLYIKITVYSLRKYENQILFTKLKKEVPTIRLARGSKVSRK